MSKKLITIDPGAGGGIAHVDKDGQVQAIKMPKTFIDIIEVMRELQEGCNDVIIEKVGAYRPGNSGPSSAKFARHCGHLEAICATLGFSVEMVSPQKWMKKLATLPKDKKDRKNTIKQIAQLKYPHLRVTLNTSDALGIMKVYKD